MNFGLAGFGGSGKTTLFNAMTGLDAPVGFGGELRAGTVRVPDPRLDALSRKYVPRKTTYATISFWDIPGDHSTGGRVLSSATLQQIRDKEAICLVLRDFANHSLDSAPDPLGELEAFHAECVLSDLGIVERRLDRARKELAGAQEIAAFETMAAALEAGQPLRLLSAAQLNRDLTRGYNLLTDLPLLIAVNRDEARATEPLPADLAAEAEAVGGMAIVLSAQIEAEIARLEPEEQVAFLRDLGLAEPALVRFIRASYRLMGLISFFTTGDDEVRAWTVREGTVARTAAGRIHSDLERGFIRAEVIPYEVFAKYGSEAAVKDAGLLQVEGKAYVVQDGDILHVRFNV